MDLTSLGLFTVRFYFKGLFHHFANTHIWQCNFLTGVGHLRGHEPSGPEHPSEKNVWPAVTIDFTSPEFVSDTKLVFLNVLMAVVEEEFMLSKLINMDYSIIIFNLT